MRGPAALRPAIARNHGVEEILTLDDGLPAAGAVEQVAGGIFAALGLRLLFVR